MYEFEKNLVGGQSRCDKYVTVTEEEMGKAIEAACGFHGNGAESRVS